MMPIVLCNGNFYKMKNPNIYLFIVLVIIYSYNICTTVLGNDKVL